MAEMAKWPRCRGAEAGGAGLQSRARRRAHRRTKVRRLLLGVRRLLPGDPRVTSHTAGGAGLQSRARRRGTASRRAGDIYEMASRVVRAILTARSPNGASLLSS